MVMNVPALGRFKSTATDLMTTGFSKGKVTRVDVDSQNATLPAATLSAGLLVHTSVTGAGTLTVSTGALLDAAFPNWTIGETRWCWYVNDGNQTVTLTAGASGTTLLAAATIATLQGRQIVFLKTAAETYSVWAA